MVPLTNTPVGGDPRDERTQHHPAIAGATPASTLTANPSTTTEATTCEIAWSRSPRAFENWNTEPTPPPIAAIVATMVRVYAATIPARSGTPPPETVTEMNAIIDTGGESVNSAPTVPILRYSKAVCSCVCSLSNPEPSRRDAGR